MSERVVRAPADRQTAGVTAWYLARFAQSGYTNAMRGNWICCLAPNLTGAGLRGLRRHAAVGLPVTTARTTG